jgi:molecular chaperone DnaK
MSTPTIYGIDLGTTCSTIGRVEHGIPTLVEIDGSVLVPSIVSFRADGSTLVGRAAENNAAVDPERTIRSAKRFMGTDHKYEVDGRWLGPGDVATVVLRYLADGVLRAHGTRPERVVITVPAWFTQPARAETQRAAEAAGLEVVRLINEPTAAALAHAHGQPTTRRALVYDFGGGTFDVSLVEQSGTLVEVRASHGDTRLGGDDVDAALAELVRERVAETEPSVAELLRTSRGARERLLLAVRDAKHTLSEALEATVRVPFLGDVDGRAVHLEQRLDRADVERVVQPLVQRTLESVDTVLADTRMRPGDIDELLLVGGSTRMPSVWHALHQHYGLEGSAAIAPDLAVGLGAAIQAAIVEDIGVATSLIDVAPHSLAVTAADPTHTYLFCTVITPRNAPLPARHTERFQTAGRNQREAAFVVVQGSDPNPLRNTVLGKFSLDGLPAAPAGREGRPLAVEFRHDLDGIVTIRVTDELSGRSTDGHVVAGGAEAREQREELIRQLEFDRLIPGDGTDADPWLEHEVHTDVRDVDATGAMSLDTVTLTPPSKKDGEEAKAAFQRVLGREVLLKAEHPTCGKELCDLARAGLTDLAQGDIGAGVARYDELADLMFVNGVYL